MERRWPKELSKAKVGLLLHPASVSSNLEHSLARFREHDSQLYTIQALFGPQHGFLGHTQDNMIEWEGYQHPELGISVYSLYGEHRKPTEEMLEGLDALVIDLQDVGARYYTFIWTMYLCMEACEASGIPVVVLDRPNPINGVDTEGPLLDIEYKSFVGLHPVPVRHGKTIGQLARPFKEEAFPQLDLHIMEMEGWEPSMWYDETGLPWVLPSPNMPTLDTATVYPGMCLLEATNVSEGRGTTKPFELFGAPFIRGEEFQRKLNKLGLDGVYFREAHFQPGFHKFENEMCHGVQIHVTNRKVFRPFEMAVEIIRCFQADYGEVFKWKAPPYEYEYEKLPIEILIGGPVESFFKR